MKEQIDVFFFPCCEACDYCENDGHGFRCMNSNIRTTTVNWLIEMIQDGTCIEFLEVTK